MLRRSPQAVLVAHAMDTSRKELYVEGQRDRLILLWLLGVDLSSNVSVREIAFVDLPIDMPGGERGRLTYFANWLGQRDVRIRMFADADWDRLLERPVPTRVWLTDHRDMEGYVFCERCIDRVLRLGIGTDRISAAVLLANFRENGRRLGLIRIMSELDGLNLPFQGTRLGRHLQAKGGHVSLDLNGYLRALLQNAGISLSRLEELRTRLLEVEQAYASVADAQIIHGKDGMCLLTSALSNFGVSPEDCPRLLWSTFDQSFAEGGSILMQVTLFLSTP